MVESELFESFEQLSTNHKRNSLNEEMLKIYEILHSIIKNENTNDNTSNISNYNQNTI